MRLQVALLNASIPLDKRGRAQLLPFGEFAGRDGRPGKGRKWKLSNAAGLALAAALNTVASQSAIPMDYEHQTWLVEKNGQAAPAAGWMENFEWLDGKGLYSDVKWTARARTAIEADEYRYISPVITFDSESGEICGLLNAALTNFPNLLGMDQVVARCAAYLSDEPKENDMALLAALIAALGLPATTTETDITTAIKAQHGELQALKAKPAVPVALATALGVKADADEATAVAALSALKGGGDAASIKLAALSTEVATLQSQLIERDLQELLDGALKASKITPAEVDSLKAIGKKDLAWLRTHLAAKTAIAGLNGQSGGKEPGGSGAQGTTADELVVCRAMGITPEQFKKAGEAMKAQA